MLGEREFVEGLHAHERTLYRVARSILRTDADCADAVQEAALKAWAARGRFRRDGSFKAWITRILINECHTLNRKRRRLVLTDDPSHFDRTAAGGASDLKEALFALEETLRLPTVLHYLEGFSIDEVAALVGAPAGTVKWRLSKARGRLKEWLSDDE